MALGSSPGCLDGLEFLEFWSMVHWKPIKGFRV